MLTVIEGKIKRGDEKIGWIDGHHVRLEDGTKLGYLQEPYIFKENGQKKAYTHEGKLVFENDGHAVSLDHVNQHISGGIPLAMKCAIYALLED